MKIKLFEYYRLRSNPDYGWAYPVEKLAPKQYPNQNNYIVYKCHYSVNKNDEVGLVKYFRPIDLIKI